MKRTLLLLCLAALLHGQVATQTTNHNPFGGVQARIDTGLVFSANIVDTGDAVLFVDYTAASLELCSLDSTSLVIDGRLGAGPWVKLDSLVGDTLVKNSFINLNSKLPLSFIRIRTHTKVDSGVQVRLIARTY